MELEWAMHQGVVLVALPVIDVPAVDGVEALIVVEGAVSQLPDPHEQSHGYQPKIEEKLPSHRKVGGKTPGAFRLRRNRCCGRYDVGWSFAGDIERPPETLDR